MAGHGLHAHPAPGVSIDYFAAGEGRPLVLVHGITESRRTWDPLIAPVIAAGYRVIAVDLRGHGASSRVAPYDLATMAGDLGAVLAEEGVADALLVGHSLGGAVVSAAATGGACRGVVNVDQPLALAAFQESLRAIEPLLRGAPAEFAAAMSAVFDQLVGPLPAAERQRVDWLRSLDQDVVLGVWAAVLESPATELEATVDALAGAITVPYLSLHGIDPGPDYADWLASRIVGAEVEVWADHGHYPHLVDPVRFVERLIAFDRSLG